MKYNMPEYKYLIFSIWNVINSLQWVEKGF